MVSTLRAPLSAFVIALSCGCVVGCSFYTPTLVDCALTCQDMGPCPRGTECRNGFCRLPSAMGECACKPGDTRPCGGGRGECKPGAEVCSTERVWSGVCTNEKRPGVETCNNKDDDCNGLIDDAVTDSVLCTIQVGVCAGARQTCEAGSQMACGPQEYGARYEAVESRCDGFDNDCDGQIDVRSPVPLVLDAAPTGPFQLLALNRGFALVYERRPPAAGVLQVARFDDALQLVGTQEVLNKLPAAWFARALGDEVFVVSSLEGGVTVSRAGATVSTFQPLVDAGYRQGLRLGVDDQVISTFGAEDGDQARLVIWNLDGGLRQVKDLNNVPGALSTESLNSVNCSDQGHYVILSAENAARTIRQLIRLGDGGVWTPPFYGGVDAELNEWDAGVSAAYAFSDPDESLSGVYYLPDLTQGLTEVAAAASPLSQEWGAASVYRARSGELQVVMQQRLAGVQQLVLGTSVPTGGTFAFRLRALDGGYGLPQLVPAATAGWLIVGWRDGSTISARRACAP